ncbi:beta-lactamase-like protein [Dichotomopilus funicola]|uniref:Beta-lactamase-like protein n=1 Tax=Dichotomopilus funicola TaxID=1934379 RepID=A0AAN6V7B0_9PEZI|nr:beta-lactamase-like protein [Dichotomopilus funicola]
MSPTFATPLPQSPRSPILEWSFPRPFHQLTLTGRSRAAWHTSFVIPQLNLLLDAGLIVNNQRPKQIFLTHGHSDHTLLAPAFVKKSDPPDVFCPAEMAGALDRFVEAKTMLSEGGGVWPPPVDGSPYLRKKGGGSGEGKEDGSERPRKEDSGEVGQRETLIAGTRGNGDQEEDEDEYGDGDGPPPTSNDPTDPRHPLLRTHHTHPLRPGDTVVLPRLPASHPYTATAFACDHTVPCLGYLFCAVTNKLKPEYQGLSGPELRALKQKSRESGEGELRLSTPVPTPVFAFLGDTTASTLASDPVWLAEGVKVVITECSFLYAEEHREQAERTRHTLWADLEPVIRRWPKTIFVLTHFSLRYSDKDIRAFFRSRDVPDNVVVWIDGKGGERGQGK